MKAWHVNMVRLKIKTISKRQKKNFCFSDISLSILLFKTATGGDNQELETGEVSLSIPKMQ